MYLVGGPVELDTIRRVAVDVPLPFRHLSEFQAVYAAKYLSYSLLL